MNEFLLGMAIGFCSTLLIVLLTVFLVLGGPDEY